MLLSIRLLLLLIPCMIANVAAAQNTQIELLVQGGSLLPHRPALVYLREGHSSGVYINFSKRSAGNKAWHQTHNMPITGIEMGVLNTGNKKQLGLAYSINRTIELPLGSNPKSLFRFKMGGGLGYLTKHFSKYDNEKNAAIGSAFNVSILLSFEAKISLKQTNLSIGTRLQHFSNGSLAKPNLGINIPSLFVGIAFPTSKKSIRNDLTVPDYSENLKPRFRHQIIGSMGIKSIGGHHNTLYGAWNLAYILLKNVSPKFSLNAFTDVGYNNSHPAFLRLIGSPSSTFLNLLQIGSGIGCYTHFGNTSVFIQQGVYFQSQLVSNEGFLYNKFGVEQFINERFSVQLSLKSHLAKADYFALACVYTL